MEKHGTSGLKFGTNNFNKSKVPPQGKPGPVESGGKYRNQRISPKMAPTFHSTPKDRSHLNGSRKNGNDVKPSFSVLPLPLINFKPKEELDADGQKQEKVRLDDALMKLNINALKNSDQHFNHLIVTSSQSAMYEYDSSIGNWNKTSTVGCLFIYLRNCAPVYGIVIMNRMAMENMYLLVNPHTEFELSEPYLLAKLEDGIRCFWFYTTHECLKVARALMKLGMDFKPEDKKKLNAFEESEVPVRKLPNYYSNFCSPSPTPIGLKGSNLLQLLPKGSPQWDTDESPVAASPIRPIEACDLSQVLEKLALCSQTTELKGQLGTLLCPTPIKLFPDGNKSSTAQSSPMKKLETTKPISTYKSSKLGGNKTGKSLFRASDEDQLQSQISKLPLEYMQTVEQLERGKKERGSSGSDSSAQLDSNYDPAIIRCTPPGIDKFDTKSFEASLKQTLGLGDIKAHPEPENLHLPEPFQKLLASEVTKSTVSFGDFGQLLPLPLKNDLFGAGKKKLNEPVDFFNFKNADKPLTKQQLVDVMTQLLQNDDEFVSKIHASYLSSLKKTTH